MINGRAKFTDFFKKICVFYHLSLEFYSSLFYFLYFLGTDYIYMNSAVYRNGTSFVESLFETFGEILFMHNVHLY